MRRSVLAALIGVLVLVAWLVLRSDSERENSATPLAPVPIELPDVESVELDRAPAPTAEPEQAVGRRSTTVHPEAADSASTEPEPAQVLEGTVVVRDGLGRSYAEEDGVLWVGTRREPLAVPVASGRFRVERATGEACPVLGLELGQRITAMTEQVELVPGTAAQLEAVWYEPTRLRVVSAETGGDLDGIDITGDYGHMTLSHHPGANWKSRTIARDQPSPVVLGSPRRQLGLVGNPFRAYFVRAPGHAWKAAVVNLEEGGTNLVELLPGGDLKVVLEGYDRASDYSVSIEYQGDADLGPGLGRPTSAHPDEHGALLFESVPTGAWSLRVRLNHEQLWGEEVAQAEAVVEAGRTTEVRLLLPVIETVQFARMAGVLVVGEGWGEQELALQIVPRSERGKQRMTTVRLEAEELSPVPGSGEVPGAGRELAWDAGELPAGPVHVAVAGVGLARVFELGPGGLENLRIVCPPPAEIELTLLHAATGEVLDVGGISLHGFAGDQVTTHRLLSARADDDQVMRFRAAPGSYRFEVQGWRGNQATYALEVGPGHNFLKLELLPPGGVTISFREGERALPARFGLVERIEFEGAEVKPVSQSLTRGKQELSVTLEEPGKYRLHFSKLDGYRPLPPTEVRVEPGEFTELVLQLEREE